MQRKDIKKYSLKELEEILADPSLPRFRIKQIYTWLYKEGVHSFDSMTNLPLNLRQTLEQQFFISSLSLEERQVSRDGVEKLLFRLSDGAYIESVIIRGRNRATLCISSQVGCKMQCLFCASGAHGFRRNLSIAEIMDQVLYVTHDLGRKITNYVFMGMGEPLDNYDNVIGAIERMNDPLGLCIASRRITVSTCGIIPAIERLKHLGLEINLSISLHATTQEEREKLMPIARVYSLPKLLKTCKHYYEVTKRAITLEYALISDVNDRIIDADNLVIIARELRAKVNLIPFSSITKRYHPSSDEDTRAFISRLSRLGDKVSIRKSRGSDIAAACGQLAGRMQ